MPIKGLTNRQPSFTQIGTIHKGTKKRTVVKNGREIEVMGKDLDYFRMSSDEEGVEEAFIRECGEQPRKLDILLPYAGVDENWEACQEEYRAGGLVHRCDGETMARWQKDDGTYSNEPQPCPYHAGTKQRKPPQQPGCLPIGRLRVILPDLKRLAFAVVETHSINDIANLDAQLRALAGSGNPPRDLRGIPLVLRRRKKMVSTPEVVDGKRTGKRVRREKWLLDLEVNETWAAALLEVQQRMALPGRVPLALPAGPTTLIAGATVDTATGEVLDTGPGPDWDQFGSDDEDDADIEDGEYTEQEPPPESSEPQPPAEPKQEAPQESPKPQAEPPKKPAPPKPPEKKATGKPAGIKAKTWTPKAGEFAKATPYFMKNGVPDFAKMASVAGAEGVIDITDDNLDQTLDLLRSYAAKHTEKEAQS